MYRDKQRPVIFVCNFTVSDGQVKEMEGLLNTRHTQYGKRITLSHCSGNSMLMVYVVGVFLVTSVP